MAWKELLKKLRLFFLDQQEQHVNLRTRWLLRVLALAIAVVLWFFVTWDGNTQGIRTFRVDLKYANLPEGYAVASAVNKIEVRISGRVDMLSELAGETIAAELDLQGLQPGKYKLPVRLRIPTNTKLESVSPTEVNFEIYRMIERTIAPQVKVTGAIPPGQTIRSVEIAPDEVTLKGPESLVLSIQNARVEPTFDQLRSQEWVTLPVRLDEMSSDTGLNITPSDVKVRATIAEEMRPIRVPVVVKLEGKPRQGHEIDFVKVAPETVEISGPAPLLEQYKEIELQPIDVTDAAEDIEISVPLVAPNAEIAIDGPEFAKVTVHLKKSMESRMYMNVPIYVIGKGVYKSWSLSPPVASVMLEYRSDGSVQLGQEPPLELYVDVTNVVSRQLRLPLLVRDVKEGVTVVRLEPEQVLVQALDP